MWMMGLSSVSPVLVMKRRLMIHWWGHGCRFECLTPIMLNLFLEDDSDLLEICQIQIDNNSALVQVMGWPSSLTYTSPGERFKNTYELLNLRALKISKLHKNHIFQCMGKIFCVEFQRVPLKFHTKYLTHTLKDVDFIHIWKFKSSLI